MLVEVERLQGMRVCRYKHRAGYVDESLLMKTSELPSLVGVKLGSNGVAPEGVVVVPTAKMFPDASWQTHAMAVFWYSVVDTAN